MVATDNAATAAAAHQADMENPPLADGAPAQGAHGAAGGGGGAPQPAPQLPPQMFTAAAQLLDLTDKKLMVVLRDGRKLIGVLRSWDQFANLVLQSTTERVFAVRPDGADAGGEPRRLYADVWHGVFLVRGENVLLLGEIDLDRDDDAPPGHEPADYGVVKRLADERRAADRARERARLRRLATMGFEGETMGDMML